MARISIIVCIAKNRGIGKNNDLLFRLRSDMKHFREITTGHPVIMGINTFKSIGVPLPKRLNIVLSPEPIEISGCIVVNSLDLAKKVAAKNDKEEIFFIGGGMVYRQAIKFADRLYLTVVDEDPDADTFFPEYDDFTKVISDEPGEENGFKYRFITLEK